MSFCPYYSPIPDNYRVEPKISFARFLHAVPDGPPVDIYVTNKLIARNVRYREFTEYLPIPPGNYNLKVYPTGKTKIPIINIDLDVPYSKIFTVSVVGTLAQISLLPIAEPKIPMIPGKAYLRFIHLSPDAPKEDVKLANGTSLFKNVAFKDYTDYIPINPGNYAFLITAAGSKDVLLTIPHIHLSMNKFYSLYEVGLAKGKPSLQVLVPLDGNTYLKV